MRTGEMVLCIWNKKFTAEKTQVVITLEEYDCPLR